MAMGVQEQLEALERALLSAQRHRVCCEPGWTTGFSALAGVYAIWDRESGVPVYVGETSGLLARMGDLGRTPNHTFRRIARKRFHLDNATELELNTMLASRFEIALLEVSFGRAELEEYLILRWRTTLWNKVARRLQQSEQYRWVRAD